MTKDRLSEAERKVLALIVEQDGIYGSDEALDRADDVLLALAQKGYIDGEMTDHDDFIFATKEGHSALAHTHGEGRE